MDEKNKKWRDLEKIRYNTDWAGRIYLNSVPRYKPQDQSGDQAMKKQPMRFQPNLNPDGIRWWD